MDFEAFQHSTSGHLINAIGGHRAFLPNPLPPQIVWTPQLVNALSDADRAVGYLGGLGQILPNPYLLVRPLQRQEAVLSSRIEGTQASLSDLYVYEGALSSAATQSDDVQEVHNYVRALEYGLQQLRDGLPITLRLVCEMHAILMNGVRGTWRKPGKFRVTQNWIGPTGCRLEEATYVPPPPEHLQTALDAWERFLHTQMSVSVPALPPLARLALVHYQFEALHPFLDGNGRIGRLIIALLLAAWGILPQPLLYLSAYFERRRQMYYTLLLDVSQKGDWESWLSFFLHSVVVQSRATVEKGQRVLALHTAYRERYASSSKLQALVDLLFENPVVTGGVVLKRLKVSSATAYQYLALMERDGILNEITGRKRGRRYMAREVIDIIEEPLDLATLP